MSSAETSIIPLVDFAAWKADAPMEEKKLIAAKLIYACQNVGFVFIINYNISPERLEEAFGWSKQLFGLPHDQKMLAPHPSGHSIHRGYSWPGLEKVSNAMGDEKDPDLAENLRAVSDVKESYEVGSEMNPDQPNVWLSEEVLPGFRSFMTNFYWECHDTAQTILSAMALGIGLPDEHFFRPTHSGHNNQLRLLHYPPVPAAELESQSLARMQAHSDWGSITLVFQDDCGGLQVASNPSHLGTQADFPQIENPHKPGDFIDAPPLKDAIIMNLGDLMMRWSNDTLKSTLHRVGLPPKQDRFTGDERMTRERYSIPYFVSPEDESIIECLSSCTTADRPAKYKPIRWGDYRLMRASMQYETKEAETPV